MAGEVGGSEVTSFTDAQEEALQRAIQIIREHFEGGVIVVTANDSEDEETAQVILDYAWHGGGAQAIGLLDLARDRMKAHYNTPCTDE